jgi:hypothetical protein
MGHTRCVLSSRSCGCRHQVLRNTRCRSSPSFVSWAPLWRGLLAGSVLSDKYVRRERLPCEESPLH